MIPAEAIQVSQVTSQLEAQTGESVVWGKSLLPVYDIKFDYDFYMYC